MGVGAVNVDVHVPAGTIKTPKLVKYFRRVRYKTSPFLQYVIATASKSKLTLIKSNFVHTFGSKHFRPRILKIQ